MTGLTIAGGIGFLLLGALAGMLIAWLWAKARHAEDKARHAEEKAALTAELQLARAAGQALEEKLQGQTRELEGLNRKFSTEFENLAQRIFETKAERFTQLNKTNLENLLTPLGKTLNDFKDQINRVYDAESKERFSLGVKVKELAQLNQQLSEDAKNLTKALKGEAKTQGRWGEVILESILERSGLRKGEEFFMEYQLYDAEGRALRSEAKGSRMRPDAIVKYPDDRHVIIDAKVSLNAFVRFVEATDPGPQKAELQAHVRAIKDHVADLSTKAYDDYHKTLDFVMLFIPSEAAYIAALQGDPELWNYAYDRRILLINPSNLIVSLKLIVDLWKREYQNLNAQAIADRGAKLYDKFTGFVKNLQGVGIALDAAQNSYQDAWKQLSAGKDNLVAQATKLKDLGVKTKGQLPSSLLNDASAEEE
ncbi:DNA recombination protein RmuC [Puia sp.]|jgi:DNA recombination protein RmuC|uniref:DNA recombination protein RmuC n=1 Tax=Puia sp. TaxID=2045100 RepID=UPI002F42AC1B